MNIEAFRVVSKAKKKFRCEILRVDTFEQCAENSKRGVGRPRVFRVRFYKHKVDVLREARLRMINYGEGTHNEVSYRHGTGRRTKGLCSLGTSGSIFHPFSS